MEQRSDPGQYWNTVAQTKVFSHPLPGEWLEAESDPILDVGCGYGRSVRELADLGLEVVGVDTAEAMVARGRLEHPDLDLRAVAPGAPLPFGAGHFATALLFAVLTCIPGDGEQRALLAEVRRVLRPGGQLLISDLPLQAGARERKRYAVGEAEHGRYGVFTLPDGGPAGGIVRHQDEATLASYTGPGTGFSLEGRRELEAVTMNGNPCRIVQLRLRKLD